MANESIEARAQHRIDAFRLASLQGPVLQGPPPIQSPPAPTFAFFFAKLTPKDRIRAIKEVKDGVVKDWKDKWDSAHEAMGLTKPPARERILVYDGIFQDEAWKAELASKFPFRFAELNNDYLALLERRDTGKL